MHCTIAQFLLQFEIYIWIFEPNTISYNYFWHLEALHFEHCASYSRSKFSTTKLPTVKNTLKAKTQLKPQSIIICEYHFPTIMTTFIFLSSIILNCQIAVLSCSILCIKNDFLNLFFDTKPETRMKLNK